MILTLAVPQNSRASRSQANKQTVSMVPPKGPTPNNQQMTLIQKPQSAVNAGPSAKIVTVNRPHIKISSGPPGKVFGCVFFI